MTRRAMLRRGMLVAGRFVAATLLCVMWLIPAAIARADGPQPPPCTFLADYPNAAAKELSPTINICEASFAAPNTAEFIYLQVFQFTDPTSVATALASVELARDTWSLEAAPYGQEGFAGTSASGSTSIAFVWHNYTASLTTIGGTGAIAAAHSAAASLNTAMQAGIGPPAQPTASPGVGGSAGPSPSSNAGALEVGIGCAQDGIVLRCTSSVSGQGPDADLTYHWTIDGIDEASTGGTMEADLKARGLRAASHVVKVTVTDQVSHATGSRDLTIETTVSWFAVTQPSCTSGPGTQGSFELRCTTTVLNAPAGADLTFDWNVDGKVQQGGASISRDVQQGIVAVAVSARDLTSGQFTAVETAQYAVNPTGILTDILTGGQTSDPQNVIDEITGSALGAAALGAGAAIAGAFGAIGGVATGGAAAAGAGTAGSAAGGSGGGAASSTGASAGATAPALTGPAQTPSASTGPTPDQVGDAAGDLLAAEGGTLPDPTPDNAKLWKDLTGWPPGEVQDEAFSATMNDAIGRGLEGQDLRDHLRAQAQALWQEMRR